MLALKVGDKVKIKGDKGRTIIWPVFYEGDRTKWFTVSQVFYDEVDGQVRGFQCDEIRIPDAYIWFWDVRHLEEIQSPVHLPDELFEVT